MKRILTSITGVVVAAVASGGLLAGVAGNAHASTAPPWEPDPSSVGGLTFYNAAGHQVTGGSTTASPLASYVEGSSKVRSGDTKATLYGYLPVHGQSPGQWSGDQLSASTSYPNASAPRPLKTASLPVVSGASGDETIAELAADFPNTDSSSDGYAHLYQLRLVTSKPQEGISTTYDSADIEISGSTWSVVYSQAPGVSTSTKLRVSPSGRVVHGTKVKLRATITPAKAAGSVQFRDGSKVLKTVKVKAGKASFSTRTLRAAKHKLTAKFVPSTSGYATSTSSKHSLTVKAHPTRVSLKASTSTIKKGNKLTLKVKESPAAAGKVAIFDGSKKLATVKVKKGKATVSTTKLTVGSHRLKAKFTPKKTSGDATSTSKVVKVKVTG